MTEISDLLLRIAKLYQIKDFDPESAVLLAEWVIDEYKHTEYSIVKQALYNPPILKEKTWRLTPEVIGDWIEIIRQRIIDQNDRAESELRQTAKIIFPACPPEIDALLNETKAKLKSIDESKTDRVKTLAEMKKIRSEDEARRNGHKSVSVGYKPLSQNEVAKRVWHLNYIMENYDSVTKSKKPNWKEETQWLEEQGIVIVNGELIDLNAETHKT